MLRRKEWDREYLNPHVLDKFFNDNPDDGLCRLCTECSYFANLDIDTDNSSEFQTIWQPYLLATGIFLSPAFWVSVALPMDLPVLMLISIIAIIVSSVIGICLFLYGYGAKTQDVDQTEIKKIESWFKGISLYIISENRNDLCFVFYAETFAVLN